MNCVANREKYASMMNHEIKWALDCLKEIPFLSESTKLKLADHARWVKGQMDSYPQREEQNYNRKLNQLQTEQQKTVYDLRYHGYTAQSIAEDMQCSVRTVRRINKQIAMILGSGC